MMALSYLSLSSIMLPSTATAFVPSSTLWKNSCQASVTSSSSFSTSAAPKHLHLCPRDDDDDNQHITNYDDNLLLPTAAFLFASTFASICTIWSEFSVVMTGCGPPSLSDAIERNAYLSVIVVAGSSVFVRIVSGGKSLSQIYANNTSKSDMNYSLYVNFVEILSLLAVVGAFVALAAQSLNGERMDGLSGVNIDMCRAIQQSLDG